MGFSVLKYLPDFLHRFKFFVKMSTFSFCLFWFYYHVSINQLSEISRLALCYISPLQLQNLRNIWGEVLGLAMGLWQTHPLQWFYLPIIVSSWKISFCLLESFGIVSHRPKNSSDSYPEKTLVYYYCLLYPKIHSGQAQSSASTHSQKNL